MEAIISAREFMESCPSTMKPSQMMVLFAKLHVQQALKQASEKAEYNLDGQEHIEKVWIDKNSILNAYSLDNIK